MTIIYLVELFAAAIFVLISTLIIGIIAFWRERSNNEDVNSADLFFTGNRQLRTIPMTLSLIATIVTPLSWLTLPATVAELGLAPAVTLIIGLLISAPIIIYLFLPVFFYTQPVTAFEYLEQRFNRPVKLMASGLFLCYTITVLPAMLYVPMAVLQNVTNIQFIYSGPVVLLVALGYTTLGGMRAVQWASCLHIAIASISLLSVVTVGCYKETINNTWKIDSSTSVHLSRGWASGFALSFLACTQLACGQPQVQRYLSVPLLQQSKMAVFITSIATTIFVLLLAIAGVLMPIGEINEHYLTHYQQFIMYSLDVVSEIPGLQSLIVAALCSLSLSSLASGVHACSAVLTMDVFRSRTAHHWHELPVSRGRLIMAIASILILIASALMMFFPDPLIQVAIIFPKVTSGTFFGLFCLGLFIPWANVFGAISGTVLSLIFIWFLSFGTSIISFITHDMSMPEWNVPAGYFAPIGCFITVLVGSLISIIGCPTNASKIDPDLISPFTRWLYKKIKRSDIGDQFEDTTVQDDFQYEAQPATAIPTRILGSPYSRGGVRVHAERRRAQQQQRQQRQVVESEGNWPDVAYSHLKRRPKGEKAVVQRPVSGLAWDSNTGELYLQPLTHNNPS